MVVLGGEVVPYERGTPVGSGKKRYLSRRGGATLVSLNSTFVSHNSRLESNEEEEGLPVSARLRATRGAVNAKCWPWRSGSSP